jgi:predicted  nucleic acid-binding Zn-ribbon protein
MVSDLKIEISPALLRTLHRIHRQRTDLKSQIERGPRQIKAGEALIAQAVIERDKLKEKQKRATLASDEKQLQLKSREMRLVDREGKLNAAASNREYSLLKEQIAADKQANSVLGDEILEALEQLDLGNELIRAAEQEIVKLQSDHAKRVDEVEAKLRELRAELQRVEDELSQSETKIPAGALADYKRLTDARGEEALAPVDGDSCGGCFQTLTTQLIDRLRMRLLIRCPSCNAFLYFPEDR